MKSFSSRCGVKLSRGPQAFGASCLPILCAGLHRVTQRRVSSPKPRRPPPSWTHSSIRSAGWGRAWRAGLPGVHGRARKALSLRNRRDRAPSRRFGLGPNPNPPPKPSRTARARVPNAEGASMPINILMPALSPTMEKGNIAKWLKKEGDKVKAGDILAEIETDKATMEYEAIDEGVIAKILVPEGTADVAVNAPIAVLAAEGEDVKTAVASAPAVKQVAPSPPAGASKPAAAPQPSPPPPYPPPLAGEGREGVPTPASPVAPAPAANGRGRIFASPLARR